MSFARPASTANLQGSFPRMNQYVNNIGYSSDYHTDNANKCYFTRLGRLQTKSLVDQFVLLWLDCSITYTNAKKCEKLV